MGKTWDDPNHMKFFNDGAVTFPYLSDGMWFLTQHKRWGLLKDHPDYLQVAKQINQIDLYKEAATATKVSVPKDVHAQQQARSTAWSGTARTREVRRQLQDQDAWLAASAELSMVSAVFHAPRMAATAANRRPPGQRSAPTPGRQSRPLQRAAQQRRELRTRRAGARAWRAGRLLRSPRLRAWHCWCGVWALLTHEQARSFPSPGDDLRGRGQAV